MDAEDNFISIQADQTQAVAIRGAEYEAIVNAPKPDLTGDTLGEAMMEALCNFLVVTGRFPGTVEVRTA